VFGYRPLRVTVCLDCSSFYATIYAQYTQVKVCDDLKFAFMRPFLRAFALSVAPRPSVRPVKICGLNVKGQGH